MVIHFSPKRALLLLVLSSSLLALPSCSPKIKLGIWAKKHKDAAQALGTWAANNPIDAAGLLNIDCIDRKQFKKKINDALSSSSTEQPARTSGYDVRQHNYHYGNSSSGGNSRDSFADWCRKYPKAAKTLRGHAKAMCKTGLGILNGSYKIE
jgi:hypothetical protein